MLTVTKTIIITYRFITDKEHSCVEIFNAEILEIKSDIPIVLLVLECTFYGEYFGRYSILVDCFPP